MNTKKNSSSPAAITFYVISVILLLVFAFNIYYSYTYVASYDVSFSDEWKTIISIYTTQCTAPFVGAVVAYGIGYLINRLQFMQDTLSVCVEDAINYNTKSNKKKAAKKEDVKEDIVKVEKVKEETKEEKVAEEKPQAEAKKKKAEPKKKAENKEEAKKAEPKKEEVKTEVAKPEETKTEKPKTEEPKAEETKTEETKA